MPCTNLALRLLAIIPALASTPTINAGEYCRAN
jgi:hypothetical protein